MGLVNLTTEAVVETIATTASIVLVALPVHESFGASPLGLVERTVASSSGRESAMPDRVCLTLSAVGEVL